MKTAARPRTTIGVIQAHDGRFGASPGAPFYSAKLPRDSALQLCELLAKVSDPASRRWVTITVSYHDPNRLRITHTAPPAYESRAVEGYFRGDTMRITGVEGNSINVDLSARFAVATFNEIVAAAVGKAREYVLLSVPTRKRNLLEIVADVDLAEPETDEQVKLGIAGAQVANAVLPSEDFSDWEIPNA